MRRASTEMLAALLESLRLDAVARAELIEERRRYEAQESRARAAERNLLDATSRIAGLKQGIDSANRQAITSGAMLRVRGAGNPAIGGSEACALALMLRYGRQEISLRCSRTGVHSNHDYIGTFVPQTNPPPAGHLLTISITEDVGG